MATNGNILRISVIGLICAVFVLGVPVCAAELKISPDNGGDHITPQINGNYVVWADINSNTGVYLYSVSNGAVKRISGTTSVDPESPQISGNKVIWVDHRYADPWAALFQYDIPAGNEIPLAHQPHPPNVNPSWEYFDQWKPAISGNIVTYWISNPWDAVAGREIWSYDLTSGQFRLITAYSDYGGVTNEHPRISGNTIVWARCWNNTYNILLYNPVTPLYRGISIHGYEPINSMNPDIDGNRVVYEDEDPVTGNADIVLYDIITSTTTRITNDAADQRHPAISGDLVVWDDDRNYQQTGLDIYRYNITSGVTTQITNDHYNQQNPSISGNRIVWEDDRNGSRDVYMYTDTPGVVPDTTPPVFDGLGTAIAGNGQVLLFWNAATDPSTPITYSIYQAGTAGGENFGAAPTFTTMSETYTVQSLTNGRAYYFVVRAKDSIGNQDSNTVEKSVTPLGGGMT